MRSQDNDSQKGPMHECFTPDRWPQKDFESYLDFSIFSDTCRNAQDSNICNVIFQRSCIRTWLDAWEKVTIALELH